MLSTYQYPRFEYRKPSELGATLSCPLVVVGAGPVGIATAVDLAMQGQNVVLVDDDDTVSVGSRGLCYAKRTLEVLDRLGAGQDVVDKGVTWNVGRTFFKEEEVYHFNLLPTTGYERPGMVNLQQYYLEEYLLKRAAQLPNLEVRWKSKVTAINAQQKNTLIDIETPDGNYQINAEWLVVADGARSNIRRMLDLDIDGKIFQDRFLIADVVMKADFPAERWFWFDPPFHPNQSVLLHREADNVWRIDFQLGWDADPEEEKKPEKVIPRIKAMLGDDREFELEWVSVYTFQCRRMKDFRHQRVFFVGDAAHQVSPFGARGANSGIQDADNLAWKLNLVIKNQAPESLLDTYNEERVEAADENIMNSTRSTDFITPKSAMSRMFRNSVLDLAKELPFARSLVNSGRLSVPTILYKSSLNTPDKDLFNGTMIPGAPLEDAPMQYLGKDVWLLRHLGNQFQALIYTETDLSKEFLTSLAGLNFNGIAIEPIVISFKDINTASIKCLIDKKGLFKQRFDAKDGTIYLIRPDQHVAARWRSFDQNLLQKALAVATKNTGK